MIVAINWCSFVRHHYLERENNNEPRDGSYISVSKLKVWWRNIRLYQLTQNTQIEQQQIM